MTRKRVKLIGRGRRVRRGLWLERFGLGRLFGLGRVTIHKGKKYGAYPAAYNRKHR